MSINVVEAALVYTTMPIFFAFAGSCRANERHVNVKVIEEGSHHIHNSLERDRYCTSYKGLETNIYFLTLTHFLCMEINTVLGIW